tara:strand:- start:68 stop:820 length:753 start_codon:yes stop_codon:yes gene_type:complete
MPSTSSNPNSFKDFRERVSSGRLEPSRSNLYGVKLWLPTCMQANTQFVNADRRWAFDAMNYMADQVSIPGKRILDTPVAQAWQGAGYSHARIQQNNDVDITFVTDKYQYHRRFFEHWMNWAAPDMENRSGIYEEYTTNLIITKWEVGSNISWEGLTESNAVYRQRLNSSMAVWQFFGAWPYDMGGASYSNGPTNLVKFSVKFKHERYRFDGVGSDVNGVNSPDRFINAASDGLSSVGIDRSQTNAAGFGV